MASNPEVAWASLAADLNDGTLETYPQRRGIRSANSISNRPTAAKGPEHFVDKWGMVRLAAVEKVLQRTYLLSIRGRQLCSEPHEP